MHICLIWTLLVHSILGRFLLPYWNISFVHLNTYVPIHGLYLACVLMPGVYLAFTVPGIVTLGMINNVFYIPAMYMRCILANCHIPCTWPCKQLTFLPMSAPLAAQQPGSDWGEAWVQIEGPSRATGPRVPRWIPTGERLDQHGPVR
jgi:hypothetical protein